MILYGNTSATNNYNIKRKVSMSDKKKKNIDWVNIMLFVTLGLVVIFFFFR